MMNVAISATQASEVFFKPMKDLFVESPWFKDKFANGELPSERTGVMRMNNRIDLISGHSEAASMEGKNLIAAVADEIAGFATVADASSTGRAPTKTAEGIMKMLKSSAQTRFAGYYKVVQISFARRYGDAIMQALREAKENEEEYGEKSTYYSCGPYSTWSVNPKFRDRFEFISIPQSTQLVPNDPDIITDYRKDPVFARGYYECRPEKSSNPYFKDKASIKNAFSRTVDKEPLEIEYFYGVDRLEGDKYPSWQVRFSLHNLKPIDGALYSIHADMAKNGDVAGIAMSHVKEYQEITTPTFDGGQDEERRPVVTIDFATAFTHDMAAEDESGNSIPREIQMRWFRKLVFWLSDQGFVIQSVSMDGFQCLSGSTFIPLLDGTSHKIEDLVGREDFYVYSLNKEGVIVPGLAKRAFLSGSENVYRVTLDSGEFIDATSEHLFMLRDGSYAHLRDLEPGTSLMPLYKRNKKTSPTSAEYEQVWHPGLAGEGWKQGKHHWQFTHSLVNSYFNGSVPKGSLTHHIDGTKFNNDPSNLVTMTWEEHGKVHSALASQGAERFKGLWKNEEWATNQRAIISESTSKNNKLRTGTPQKRQAHITEDDIRRTLLDLHSRGGSFSARSVASELGCHYETVYHRVKHSTGKTWKEYVESFGFSCKEFAIRKSLEARTEAPYNHKVVSVEFIGNRKVYDLEVEEFHNFAVGAGIFVHNSLDSLQSIQSKGYNTYKRSTDINNSVWQSVRDVMYDGRLNGYYNERVIAEFESLTQKSNGKVDHPSDFGKDVADAIGCSIVGAIDIGGSEDDGSDDFFGTSDNDNLMNPFSHGTLESAYGLGAMDTSLTNQSLNGRGW